MSDPYAAPEPDKMRCARCEEWQRICENLESQIAGLRDDSADRIEALEAALREISETASFAALAPEQDR